MGRLTAYRSGLRAAGMCIEGPHVDQRTTTGAARCAKCADRHHQAARDRTAKNRADGIPPRKKKREPRVCQCGLNELQPFKKLCPPCRARNERANYKAKLARLKGPDRKLFNRT